VAHLVEVLELGGYLYMRSDATRLERGASPRDRIPALKYRLLRFDIVPGERRTAGSRVEPVVARK
jgi:hypothetical protein